MSMSSRFIESALVGSGMLALSLLLQGTAAADTVVVLPSDPSSPSSLPSSTTYNSATGENAVTGAPGSTTGGITTYSLSSGTYYYGQSINQALTPFNVTTPNGTNSYAFYTDYVFTIAPNTVDSLTSSINLGTAEAVNGLEARLYDYNVGSTQNLSLPAFNPTGPVIDSWSSSANLAPGLTATDSVIAPTMLDAGTYVLEIRATSVGTTGGSFSGTLNLTPVPIPAALPLLLSGIAALGFRGRRRLVPQPHGRSISPLVFN